MKLKKVLALALAASMSVAVLSSCGGKENVTTEDGKVVITVGNWPDEETNPKGYETRMQMKADFEAKYPDIEIKTDNWSYDMKTFAAKAEGGTLPTVYNTYATELKKIINLGYSADVTETMKKYGAISAEKGYDPGIKGIPPYPAS